MPQLDVSIYATQIFWVLLTFLSFWFVMDKFIIPQISETIDARRRKYEDFILKAEKINKKALTSLKRYEETLAAAKENANIQIRQNEEELKKFISEKEDSINKELNRKIAESEERLRKEKEETLQKIEELAENTACNIINKLGLDRITLEDVKNASPKEGK